MSAPAASAALLRATASSNPATARESVRAMIVKSAVRRAAAAAAIFASQSARGTISLSSRWPHFFGKPWSSIWMPASPARSSSRIVRWTVSTPPKPVSMSAITGRPTDPHTRAA